MQHERIATESINATRTEKLTESRESINPTRLTNAQITEHTTGQIGENYEQISNCKQTITAREREKERDWDLHRVFDCVRGDDIGIVAFGESREHFGSEGDGDIPFHQVVRLAVSFASPQTSHSYARLAMLMLQLQLLLRHRFQNYTTKGTNPSPQRKTKKLLWQWYTLS